MLKGRDLVLKSYDFSYVKSKSESKSSKGSTLLRMAKIVVTMGELKYKTMTKQEFADMIGISSRTLSRWIKKIEPELILLGYDKNVHLLTPKIVEYLCMKFVVLS